MTLIEGHPGLIGSGTRDGSAWSPSTSSGTVRWIWDFASRGPLRLLGPLVGFTGRRLEQRVWANMKQALS